MNPRRVAGALVVVVLITGCATRNQTKPVKIAPRDVPFGLVQPQDERPS